MDAARADCDRVHLLHVVAAQLRLSRPAAASHRSACVLFGLDLLEHPGTSVTLTADGNRGGRSYPQLVVHRSHLPPAHVAGGTPSRTTRERCVVDLARTEAFAAAVVTADSALRSGGTDRTRLLQVVADSEGWPGSHEARRVVEFADGRAEAPSESLARVMFAAQGLPPPVPQAEVRDAAGLIGYVDFLFRAQRTIVEVDGKLKYDGAKDVLWREKRREDRLREAGHEVVRLTWAEVVHHPGRSAARIRAAFARAMPLTGS